MVKMTSALLPLPDLPELSDMSTGEADNKLPFSAGVIGCYSLKNVAHPEYLFITESGVMCLDFHPQVNYPTSPLIC
jgi:dynein intermediate chain 1, axonemal